MKKNNLWKQIGIVIVVILVAGVLLKDLIVKNVMTAVMTKALGTQASVGSFSMSLLSQKVRIKNITIQNPQGFPQEAFITIPEIGLDYDLGALIQQKLHVPLIIVDVKELIVVKNKEGKLNVDSLAVAQEKPATKEEPKKEDGKSVEIPPFQIDELKLNIGRVVYKDFSKGEPPVVQAYETPLQNKSFKNITSVPQMITLVLVQGLGPTAIKSGGLYAAATVLGVGFLPAGILGAVVADDDTTFEFKGKSLDVIVAALLKVIEQNKGTVKSSDKATGAVSAKVSGADIDVKMEKPSRGVVKVTIQARKFMLPKPEIASGILYQLQQELK
jgi:hypothetical protein